VQPIPRFEKVRGLTQKYALRKAIRGHVPADVLKKKKGALGAPIRWWVTHEDLVADHLSREVVEERGMFDYQEIAQMKEDTLTERRDCSLMLWSLFTLESWMRQFVDKHLTGLPRDQRTGLTLPDAEKRPST
jgi:asparagine synthase (glutamine-hydrolysing)